jgi:predicted glycoside hydrolase/deacetylase ChbG (UPF0249 family)
MSTDTSAPLPPNPVLQRLGLPDDARVVVLHADDIGMCQATLTAYAGALESGVLSSAATMVPCPWYPALAAFCRTRAANPRLDMGVHLTVNSEWELYRWGPLTTRDPVSGLIDAQRNFHHRARGTEDNADLAALEVELLAQVERAWHDGIDVTHVDTHMLTLFHPRLLPVYVRVAFACRLPLFLLRHAGDLFDSANVPAQLVQETGALLADAESRGMPLFDHVEVLPLDDPEDRLAQGIAALRRAPAGLTYLLNHMASDTPELRALASDWRCRVADADLFCSPAWRAAVAAEGVHVIGFHPLRRLLREALDAVPQVAAESPSA